MKATGPVGPLRWLALALIAMGPVAILLAPAFPTLDGWAHLQTARMLWNGPDGVVFCPNPAPVPNQLGHWLLALLQAILPGLVAERALLAITMLLLSMGLWMLARALGGEPAITTVFLPFTWSIFLVLGFHNFLLGSGLALVFAAAWVWRGRAAAIPLAALVAATLVLLACHNMALGLFLLIAGAHELAVLAAALRAKPAPRAARAAWRRLVLFAAACLPAVALAAAFTASQSTHATDLPLAAKLLQLHELRSLVLYSVDQEFRLINLLQWLLGGTLLIAAASQWRHRRASRGGFLLLSTAVLLVLYLALPDSVGYASYITWRLQLFFISVLVAWSASQRWPWQASVAVVLAAGLLHSARLRKALGDIAGTSAVVERVTAAAAAMPEGSVVLPIAHETNWLLGHIPSLLAAERDLIVLDNYECGQGYFPLRWCPGLPEGVHGHAAGSDHCLGWLDDHLASGAAPRIDRIVVLGWAVDTAHCGHAALARVLSERFSPVLDNGYARVHALRP